MAIKKLQNDFTTPEQSKRLLELGVPADSANCVYDCALIGGEKYYSLSILEDELFSVYKRIWEDSSTDIIPCWSVGRLIEIYEICFGGSSNSRYFGHTLIEDVLLKIEEQIDSIDFSELEE